MGVAFSSGRDPCARIIGDKISRHGRDKVAFKLVGGRGMDHIRRDGQIVIKERHRSAVIGENAANLSGAKKDGLRPSPLYPLLVASLTRI